MTKLQTFICISAFLLMAIVLTGYDVSAQRSTSIFRPCVKTSTVKEAKVEITPTGAANVVTCDGQSLLFNGGVWGGGGTYTLNGATKVTQSFAVPTANDNAFWSTNTGTGVHTLALPISAVSGVSRTGYLPLFDSANTLAKSSISENTSAVILYSGNSSQFLIDKTNSSFSAGDGADTNLTYSWGANKYFYAQTPGGAVLLGDPDGIQNATYLTVDDDAETISTSGTNFLLNNTVIRLGNPGVTGNPSNSAIDVFGKMHFNDVSPVLEKSLIYSTASGCAGSSTVTNAADVVTVTSPCVASSKSKIAITPTTNVNLYVSTKANGSFAVACTAGDCTKDVNFDWFIINLP